MKKTMRDITPAEIAAGLTKAKALIDHPNKWVQHMFECDGRICTHRAMEKAADTERQFRAVMAAFVGGSARPDDYTIFMASKVCAINNMLEHDELMAHFDKAIAQQLSGD